MFLKNVWVFILKNMCIIGRKEGNVLFNDTLNTFYGYLTSDIYVKGLPLNHCSTYIYTPFELFLIPAHAPRLVSDTI